jgi:hypothetical protein
MADDPLRRTTRPRPGKAEDPDRPKIWVEGGQRPSFDLRAFGRAGLYLARTGVAPLLAWSARQARHGAVRVRDGAGRLPADKLGRMARFVPSHLRVAGWVKNGAAVLAHASANADPEVQRGNALVAEIEPHLWEDAAPQPLAAQPSAPQPVAEPAVPASPDRSLQETEPVGLAEPVTQEADPLAAIRDEMATAPPNARQGRSGRIATPEGPSRPPAPPGPVATGAIQVAGYLFGWAAVILALPYGLARALWLHVGGVDLRGIGAED